MRPASQRYKTNPADYTGCKSATARQTGNNESDFLTKVHFKLIPKKAMPYKICPIFIFKGSDYDSAHLAGPANKYCKPLWT